MLNQSPIYSGSLFQAASLFGGIFLPLYLTEISFATNRAIASYCFAVILVKKYGSIFSLIPHQVGENSSVVPS